MAYGTVNADVIGTSVAGSNLGAGDASIMKNRIINGGCVIDQRNAGASSTPTTVGAYTYSSVDRFYYLISAASKFTMQQNAGSVTTPVGFSNYLGITSSAATSVGSSDYYMIGQAIEGFNTADLGWGTANAKSVTLSFQVYSSLTGTFGGAFMNGASTYSYPFTYTISSANTWTTISITVAGPTSGTWIGATNAVSLRIHFGLGVGSTLTSSAGSWQSGAYYSANSATNVVSTSGATFYITGVQLEVGSSATGFEYRQYTTELQLCQRYFYRQAWDATNGGSLGSGAGMVSGNVRGAIQFPVSMRASPTWNVVTISNIQAQGNGSAYSGTGYASYGASTLNQFFGLSFSGTSASGAYVLYFAGAGDPVSTFSAEL